MIIFSHSTSNSPRYYMPECTTLYRDWQCRGYRKENTRKEIQKMKLNAIPWAAMITKSTCDDVLFLIKKTILGFTPAVCKPFLRQKYFKVKIYLSLRQGEISA